MPTPRGNPTRRGHGHQHDTSTDPRTPKQRGRDTKAHQRDGAAQHPRVGQTSPKDAETNVHTAPAARNQRTPEKDGAEHPTELFDTL